MKRSLWIVLMVLAMSLPAWGLPADRTLVLPFNTEAADLDTGLAVSNTGLSPGDITFLLLANTTGGKAVVAVRTQDFPDLGVGLDEEGMLPGGETYRVLLSELADAARGLSGLPGLDDYTGQIVIETTFPAAAVNFIFDSDFETTHGYTALPVDTPLAVPVLPADVEAALADLTANIQQGRPGRGEPDIFCVQVGLGERIVRQTKGCFETLAKTRRGFVVPCEVKAAARISGPAAAAGTSVTAIGFCGAANVAIAVATVPVGGGASPLVSMGPTAKGAPPGCSVPNLFIPAGGAAPTWHITGCAFWDP